MKKQRLRLLCGRARAGFGKELAARFGPTRRIYESHDDASAPTAAVTNPQVMWIRFPPHLVPWPASHREPDYRHESLLMNRPAIAVATLCFGAFFVALPALGARGDEQCHTTAVGVQPARRALKALGIVRGKRIHQGGALNSEGSTIDPAAAAEMNSKVELHAEFDTVAQQISRDNSEVWPAAPALFPADRKTSPVADHLR